MTLIPERYLAWMGCCKSVCTELTEREREVLDLAALAHSNHKFG
ncbi:hypothetical protein [Streptomyces sp. NPDC058457]